MQESILRQKCCDMMSYGYQALRDIPKDFRYTMGSDIRSCMIQLLRLIIRCEKRYYKKTTIEEMDIELDTLRGLVMVALNDKVISPREFEIWSKQLNEIGKIIGGWKRSFKNKTIQGN